MIFPSLTIPSSVARKQTSKKPSTTGALIVIRNFLFIIRRQALPLSLLFVALNSKNRTGSDYLSYAVYSVLFCLLRSILRIFFCTVQINGDSNRQNKDGNELGCRKSTHTTPGISAEALQEKPSDAVQDQVHSSYLTI